MAAIHEHHMPVRKTGRYYIYGQPGPQIQHLWMLCHGYGQLARDFLDDCSPLWREDTLLVAPEGLSRFYQRGGRGTIGASWMTSEDRLSEIDDYLLWLNGICTAVCDQCDSQPGISVLGFSQGGATAARWGLRGNARADRIVLWGTTLPAEELQTYADAVLQTRLVIVDGEQDRIVRRGEFEEGLAVLEDIGADYRVLRHPGGHELDGDILRNLGASRK